jgi:hypothetical protein
VLGLGGCSEDSPSPAGPVASVSVSPTLSDEEREEADKAAITKVYQAYGGIQAKLDAGKPIPAAEINAVTTDPWKTMITKRAKIDPKNWVLATGPTREVIMDITVEGDKATVIECRDTTKTKFSRMPGGSPIESPEKPILGRSTFIKTSGSWLMSNYVSDSASCEMGN